MVTRTSETLQFNADTELVSLFPKCNDMQKRHFERKCCILQGMLQCYDCQAIYDS